MRPKSLASGGIFYYNIQCESIYEPQVSPLGPA